MACNCTCNCPLEVGDEIRFKLNPDSSMPHVRVNGGLRLILAYLGSKYVIYKWYSRNPGAAKEYSDQEVFMTRAEFDARVEKAPLGWDGDR